MNMGKETKTDKVILQVRNLKQHFPIMGGFILPKIIASVKAVDGVSLDLFEGETLGCVGESGCGKSTLIKTILNLYPPTDGEVMYEGVNVYELEGEDIMNFRRSVQIVFQDPQSSLNPRMTVGQIISEPLEIFDIASGRDKRQIISVMLEQVNLSPHHAYRYPHELSGGQKQRVGIARAISLRPKVLLLDEPVSALDVSVRAAIINLLVDLQKELGLTYVFVAHDLSVVRQVSDRVAIMYLGRIMEIGETKDVYSSTKHPYSEALLSAVPIADPSVKKAARIILEGDVPTPVNPPQGCRFSTRCRHAKEKCFVDEPPMLDFGNGHFCYCWFPLGGNPEGPAKK